jgi:cytoskeletal protein RodZ
MSSLPSRKRKGKPLLKAALGVAFVSFVNCEPKPPDPQPVGNLRPVDPRHIPTGTAEPTTTPTAQPTSTATAETTSAPTATAAPTATIAAPATATAVATDTPRPPIRPVGNLRPPPPPPPPPKKK